MTFLFRGYLYSLVRFIIRESVYHSGIDAQFIGLYAVSAKADNYKCFIYENELHLFSSNQKDCY